MYTPVGWRQVWGSEGTNRSVKSKAGRKGCQEKGVWPPQHWHLRAKEKEKNPENSKHSHPHVCAGKAYPKLAFSVTHTSPSASVSSSGCAAPSAGALSPAPSATRLCHIL